MSSSPSPKGAQPPIFGSCLSWSMAGWIKMPLGMEVGLSADHIVLEGDPAPLPQNGHSPQFSAHVYCGQTAGWMKMPLGTMVGLGPGNTVLDADPAPQPHNFRPMSIVAKRSPISTTAEHLSLLWSPYVIGQTIIFSSCFFLLSFFPRLISAVGHWMFTILRHMVWS